MGFRIDLGGGAAIDFIDISMIVLKRGSWFSHLAPVARTAHERIKTPGAYAFAAGLLCRFSGNRSSLVAAHHGSNIRRHILLVHCCARGRHMSQRFARLRPRSRQSHVISRRHAGIWLRSRF